MYRASDHWFFVVKVNAKSELGLIGGCVILESSPPDSWLHRLASRERRAQAPPQLYEIALRRFARVPNIAREEHARQQRYRALARGRRRRSAESHGCSVHAGTRRVQRRAHGSAAQSCRARRELAAGLDATALLP